MKLFGDLRDELDKDYKPPTQRITKFGATADFGSETIGREELEKVVRLAYNEGFNSGFRLGKLIQLAKQELIESDSNQEGNRTP